MCTGKWIDEQEKKIIRNFAECFSTEEMVTRYEEMATSCEEMSATCEDMTYESFENCFSIKMWR